MNRDIFKIEGYNYEFRPSELNAIQLLSLKTRLGFTSLEQSEEIFSFILENVEVNINGTWTKVKEKNSNIFMPLDITENLSIPESIVIYYINNVIKPLFKKSKE